MTAWPGHLAISASAGTGKTYRLAHRFIQLIMLGEAPERIIAITFSRKAAGEIFDRVILLLARAAANESEAEKMNTRLNRPGGSADDYRSALRKLLEVLPKSRVGTIDSFMVGVVRAFPYELGLDPDFDVFDSDGIDAQRCRREALRLVLQEAGNSEATRADFFEAYKYATFGNEEKRSTDLLNELIKNYQQLYRLQPDGRRWGLLVDDSKSPFKDITTWREGVEKLRELITARSYPPNSFNYWMEFMDELAVWRPESDVGNRSAYMLERIVPAFEDLGGKIVSLKFNRDEITLDKKTGDSLRAVLQFMVDEVIRLQTIRTIGMHRLIEHYETIYDEQIRRRGFLTFEDALYALRHEHLSANSPPAGAPNHLMIDYRLDGRLDHWLLDEFQDTSTMQWKVLSNLIDEVVQDHEKRRTFFYVGDIKQAIYGWRGGNAALFNQILSHYNRGESPVIALEFSSTSYRSCRPIIDTVNQVFGQLPDQVDPEVRKQWSSGWKEHGCAAGVVPDRGYVALIEQDKDQDDDASDDELRYRAAVDTMAGIDPVRRGLTAAILVRSNRAAIAVAEKMRARHPGIPVVQEGQSHIADNPAVSLLLSLLQWASHPGDLFALRHLQLSPLAGAEKFELNDSALPRDILAGIQQSGFYSTLYAWVTKLEDALELSPYEDMRVRQLLELASGADRESSRNIDQFIEMVRNAGVEDRASKRAVRIMTVHKSKGLDFDVVILPELQSRKPSQTEPFISWTADRMTPEWILQYVKKDFAGMDARISACSRDREQRQKFEDLCVLYVAMTRAARALYLITTAPGKAGKSLNHASMLKKTLCGEDESSGKETIVNGCVIGGNTIYEKGEREWFEQFPIHKAEAAAAHVPKNMLVFKHATEERMIPSAGVEFERVASRVFTSTMRERRDFGSAVHAAFEKIEWLDDVEQAASILSADTPPDVAEHVIKSLRQPEVAGLFTLPVKPCEVWREQPFEVLLDGRWISGVFDRVVITKDNKGKPESAKIFDYKTNRLDQPEKLDELTGHYRIQLETYRNVISRLIQLGPEKIELFLVFTDAGKVIDITHDKKHG